MTLPVVERIRKALAIAAAGSGATDGERAAALDAAARLMARYQIDEADVRAADAGPRRATDVVAVDVGQLSEHDWWQIDLASAIGQVYTVDAVFIQDADVRNVTLIGREASVAYVRLVYDWLVPQLRADADVIVGAERAYRELFGRTPGARELAAYREGFYQGAIVRIHERLEFAQRREVGDRGTDLVLSDRAALDDYYGDDAPTRVDDQRRMDAEAAASGYAAGARVDLDPSNKLAADRGSLPAGPGTGAV